jgi:hypothetical protein
MSRRIQRWVIARLRGSGLDRDLAEGLDPQASSTLAVRAQLLTARRSRKQLASALQRAMRSAHRGGGGFSAAVRPNGTELTEATTVLAAIDRQLRSPGPVRPQGVAMLRLLLTDAASPLYQSAEPGTLASNLRAAAAALEPMMVVPEKAHAIAELDAGDRLN